MLRPISTPRVFRTPLALALLSVLVLGTAGLTAQDRRGAGRATLNQLEAVLEKPESERIPVIRGLAKNSDPAVTTALLDELGGASQPQYRQALLDALGAIARPGVETPLLELLQAEATPPMEQMRAARGLARQGDGPLRQLARLATESSNVTARSYCLMALSQARSDLGWELLATVVRDGDDTSRGQGIRYLRRAPKTDSVTAARLAAAASETPSTATAAVRQLAEQKHPAAKGLIVELNDRAEPPSGYAAVDLLYAVCDLLEPDLHPAALRLAGEAKRASNAGARALDDLLPKLVADAAFVRFVRDELGKLTDSGRIRVALDLLTDAPGEEITAEIVAFAGSRDVEIASTALRVIAARGDPSALPALETILASKSDSARKLDALECMHALRGSEPAWHEELLGRLRRAARNRRATDEFALTLSLLAELGSEEALEFAWDALDHKQWFVRAAALDFCAVVRHVDSVPKLIDRIDEESGRLREDVLDTLRSLTAMRFNEQRRWRGWWKDNRQGFELIPADAFAKEDAAKRRPRGATAASYYGIPLVSDRVVFVVDVSGSMSSPVGTGGNRTRLDEAKAQLLRVLETTPKHFLFNIVAFDTGIDAVFDSMRRVARNRDAASEGIADLKPGGGTNVHDGLRRAFDEREVDTIYLLSDGSPSAGPVTDPNQLAELVQRWNRTRRLRIHCISIGTDSKLMRRIAEESGGEYAYAR